MLSLMSIHSREKEKKKGCVLILQVLEKMKMAVHVVTENNDFQYREGCLQSDFGKFKDKC